MTHARVQLFDQTNVDQLKEIDHESSKNIREFLHALIKNGSKEYVENVDTKVYALIIDNVVLPLTVNESQYENSYVCSPYGQYVLYAIESLKNVKKKSIKIPVRALLWGFDKLFRLGKINKVVIVNNWFFSTNLHPSLTSEQIAVIKRHLAKIFPSYAILFRSIHTYKPSEFFNSLKANKFHLIASRQVFFVDASKEEIFESRIFKSDESLLEKNKYEISDDTSLILNELDALTEMYRSIYLGKHSSLNPKLNSKFLKLLIHHNLLELSILKKDHQIDAAVGYFFKDGVMTAPFLGYDVNKPKEVGLYRMTSTMLHKAARKKKALFHLSSGASTFKKIRKGEGNIEYMAVYNNHLSPFRRMPWMVLKAISNTVGIAFMKHYEG